MSARGERFSARTVCPMATVGAPLDRVWRLLSQPEAYAAWWDARATRIAPPGAAHMGQTIEATTTAFGIPWTVRIEVQGVSEEKHELRLRTSLPFGVIAHNIITCAAVDAAKTQVSFG